MSVMKKGFQVTHKVIHGTELIYSRIIELQTSSRIFDFNVVLSYELASIHVALFVGSGSHIVQMYLY